jgi:hypothetical protein
MKETFFIRIIRHRKSGFCLNFQLENVIFNMISIHSQQPTNGRFVTGEEEPILLGSGPKIEREQRNISILAIEI